MNSMSRAGAVARLILAVVVAFGFCIVIVSFFHTGSPTWRDYVISFVFAAYVAEMFINKAWAMADGSPAAMIGMIGQFAQALQPGGLLHHMAQSASNSSSPDETAPTVQGQSDGSVTVTGATTDQPVNVQPPNPQAPGTAVVSGGTPPSVFIPTVWPVPSTVAPVGPAQPAVQSLAYTTPTATDTQPRSYVPLGDLVKSDASVQSDAVQSPTPDQLEAAGVAVPPNDPVVGTGQADSDGSTTSVQDGSISGTSSGRQRTILPAPREEFFSEPTDQ